MPRSTASTAKKAAPTAKKAARKAGTKKSAAPAGKAAAVKSGTAKAPTKKAAVRKSAGPARVSAKKVVAKKAATKKVSAKKVSAKKSSVNQSVAKKAPKKKAVTTAATTTKAPAKRSPPVKAAPSKKKSPYHGKFLVQQEKLLQEERTTYFRQFESLQAEADALVADFESGDVQFDEESGEGDTINIERERDLAVSAQARHAVEEIDHALAKIDAGTYGICEVSGDPIPPERLEAIPWAREKVEYKTGAFGRR